MEQPLALQGVQFLASLLLGAAYGLHYDFLRGLRYAIPPLKHPIDFWYGLTVLAGNLIFALLIGDGTYRIFMLVGTGLGALLYFLLLSGFFSRIFQKLWSILTLPLRFIGKNMIKILKKLKKSLKNIFSRRKKSVTIKRGKLLPKNQEQGGIGGEAQIVTHYQAHHSNAHHLRRGDHCRPSAQD